MSTVFFILLLFSTFSGIAYTFFFAHYHSYCDYSFKDQNFTNSTEVEMKIMSLCEDTFFRYSNALLLKKTLNMVNALVNSMFPFEKEKVLSQVKQSVLMSIKIEMKVLKGVNLMLYVSILCITTLVLPKLIIYLLNYLIEILGIIVLVYLMGDLLMNLLLDNNSNLVWTLLEMRKDTNIFYNLTQW